MVFVSMVCADEFMTKKAGDYTVTASFDKMPPAIGDNYLFIKIEDQAKNQITDAKVSIKYYMTAQRQSTQMPYMESMTDAEASDSGYRAKLNFTMRGPWYVVVKIIRGGQDQSATLHFDLK